MDLPEGCTPKERPWRDRGVVEARSILTKYDHLNVFDEWFEIGLAHALFKGHRRLSRKGTPQILYNHNPAFTLIALQDEYYKRFASLAIQKYNKKGKGQWALEELIYFSMGAGFSGREYELYFGARSTFSQDLEPFHAYVYCPHDKSKSEVVKSVNPLRKVDQIGSSCDKCKQLDDSIVRKTRKMTYVKQADSAVISFRNIKEDKIGPSDEKDKQVDESPMRMN